MIHIENITVIGVWTEHSYVQNPIFTVEDTELKIWNKLISKVKHVSFYKNHFVLECKNEKSERYYIGFNDNKVYFGFIMSTRNDAKFLQV